MNLQTTHSALRARRALAAGLAALITASFAHGQTPSADRLRRLEEENAALRKQIADFEARLGRPAAPAAPAAAAPAAPAAAPTSGPAPARTALGTDDGVQALSPFEVKSAKDFGYLKVNSATATRIGTEIQKVPLNISVISEEFIKDANFSDIQDVLRYQSSSAGDTRMGVLQPGNNFTPSGNLSLRGFPINSRLRNGLLRFNAYSLDNVERVEIIKGPASVFFGSAFPGGVINYVTKKPEFRAVPTSVTYAYGGFDTRMGSERATLDTNAMLSKSAALRVVAAWDNAKGDRRFEFQDGNSITPSLTLVPFASGKLRINLEAEYLRRTRNQDDTSWFYPAQWFRDYANPPAALMAAAGVTTADAYRARIFSGPGNWIADVRRAANDNYIALWTEKPVHGAYITNRAGQRVQDEKFNYYGAGTYADEENSTFAAVTEFSPVEWLDLRHSFTRDGSRYTENKSTASPNADGVTWQTLNGILKRDYILDANTHQLDLIFKRKVANIDNKLLVGGVHRVSNNAFTGTNAANLAGTGQFPFFGNLPGSFDKPDEGYVSPIPAQFRTVSFAGNFNQQFVRNRAGQILNPMQIYSLYDPGIHPNPDIRRITEVSRGLIDRSRPTRKEWYVNWQGSLLNDRLTAFLGYRKEKQTTVGQLVEANPPWFTVGEFALQNIPESQWATYGLTALFSRTRTTEGNSKMGGLSFEVTKNVNVYASYSQTYLPSGPTYLGGDYDPVAIRARAVSLGLNPDAEVQRLAAGGGLQLIKNETGENIEFGVKTSLDNNKIVSTFSVFQVTRENRAIDDAQRQFDDRINWTGPNNSGTYNRLVRWYSNDAVQRTEGAEFEVFWTPLRNYQAVASGSWMWEAKTVSDASLTVTAVNNPLARPIVFGNRLPYAPKYRLNLFQKYTFTGDIFGGYGRGFSAGLGARYSSKINIALDQNTNPSRGGLTGGNYLVFDAVFSYPWQVFGYRLTTTLNVNNVLDKEYIEGGGVSGGFNLSPPRSWLLTTGLTF